MQSRKIALFVHDLFLEIGHSNALIETIRNLPPSQVDEIVVVAYSSDNLNKLFSDLDCPVRWVKVPFPYITPVLLKVIFFHLWSWFYTLFFLQEYYKIGVGIAAIGMDLVNIQFIHRQWNALYFSMLKPKGVKYLYKRALFSYYAIVENIVFRSDKTKFLSLSQFINDYCQKEFRVDSRQIKTIYSGINLETFSPSKLQRSELFSGLLREYPTLKGLDIDRPIYLFVGAFERKGLAQILKKLEFVDRAQLIVIGKPEAYGDFSLDAPFDIFYIEFTKQLPLFYSLADAFVFASVYEPFGLVIIEAAAMGCELFVTRESVGAVELLEGLEGIHVYENSETFQILPIRPLSLNRREQYRNDRLNRLRQYTWSQTGRELSTFME
jgi:glycosyltransferase involved in cell wall biosynthesis